LQKVENSILQFVLQYAKMIALSPADVQIEMDGSNIIIYARKDDVGRIIGREGGLMKALKHIIDGCKAKNGGNYRINVRAREE